MRARLDIELSVKSQSECLLFLALNPMVRPSEDRGRKIEKVIGKIGFGFSSIAIGIFANSIT